MPDAKRIAIEELKVMGSIVMIPLTHYSGAAGPILFGAGYVTQADWWRLGFILTTLM